MRKRGITFLVAGIAMLAPAAADARPGDLKFIEAEGSFQLSNASDAAVAPDGRHVYGAGYAADAIDGFVRNAKTGKLTPIEGTSGDGLLSPSGIVVAPDGDHVYVAGDVSNSIHAYERDADGTLNNIDSVVDGESGADGLNGAYALAIAKGGKHIYVAGADDDAVALIFVNANGSITWNDAFINDIGDVENLAGPRGIAVSPDGKNVYVSTSGSGGVVTFKRFPATGQLDYVEEDHIPSQSWDISISPDGKRVYAPTAAGLYTYSRNASTGALTFIGSDDGSGEEPLTQLVGSSVSPAGDSVYASVNAGGGGIATLGARPSGIPSYFDFDAPGIAGGVDRSDVSPDGRHVYLAAGGGGNGTMVAYSRQPGLELKGAKRQSGAKLKLKAECNADCKVTLKAKGYKPASKQLKAGKGKALTLKPKGTPKSSGKVVVKGKAKAGNRTASAKRAIKLK